MDGGPCFFMIEMIESQKCMGGSSALQLHHMVSNALTLASHYVTSTGWLDSLGYRRQAIVTDEKIQHC